MQHITNDQQFIKKQTTQNDQRRLACLVDSTNLVHFIQRQDGAQIHGAHIIDCTGHHLVNDQPVCSLCRVVRIPEHIFIPVFAQVG